MPPHVPTPPAQKVLFNLEHASFVSRSISLLQGSASNEIEALEEAQEALEKVVLPTMKPIELMPRSAEVVKRQIALIEQSYGLATQTIGRGSQRRLRILPSIALSSSNGRVAQ